LRNSWIFRRRHVEIYPSTCPMLTGKECILSGEVLAQNLLRASRDTTTHKIHGRCQRLSYAITVLLASPKTDLLETGTIKINCLANVTYASLDLRR
jgi:hypothetical protein